jgi:hypothetical protein
MADSSNFPAEVLDSLNAHAKWKQRSQDTDRNTHLPELKQMPPGDELDVILLGHSFIE